MNITRVSDRSLVTIAGAAFFIWWGLADSDFGLFRPWLPPGAGWVGLALILLGLNAARWRYGIPVGGLTLTLGVLALTLGGLKLARVFLRPAVDLPILAVLVIVLGGTMLVRELALRKAS